MLILTYHSLDDSRSVISVSSRAFAEHLQVLADEGRRGISLAQALAHRVSTGHWPERDVVLTFDDGYANFLEHGLPALAAHGFAATLFLVSGHVGGCNDWAPPPPGLGRQAMLAWPQVRELEAAGVEIGAHTRTHPDLTRLAPAAVEQELAGSRRDIEQHLGQPVHTFAYPFGRTNTAVVAAARDAFRAACTTVLRVAAADPPHTLPRVDMYYLRTRQRLQRLLRDQLGSYLAVRRFARAARERLRATAATVACTAAD